MSAAKAGCAVVLAAVLPLGGPAHRKTEQGNRHYLDGDYDEALRQYTEAQVHAPDSAELFYDLGNVLFRQGDFEAAEDLYSKALGAAGPALAPKAAFNLGNARMARESYGEAAEAYRRALRGAPDDLDAKRNLELALRRLEQMQQPPPQPNPREQDGEEEQDAEQERSGERPEPPEDASEDRRAPSEQPDGEDPREAPPTPQDPEEGMSREEAERLLEGLEDQERDNLRKAARAARKARRDVEEDW